MISLDAKREYHDWRFKIKNTLISYFKSGTAAHGILTELPIPRKKKPRIATMAK
jgi:hypothetical protein